MKKSEKKGDDEFEKVFYSVWKTAKSRGITKKVVADEIKRHRKKIAVEKLLNEKGFEEPNHNF